MTSNPSFEARRRSNASHLSVEYTVVDLLGAIAVIDPIGAIDQSVERSLQHFDVEHSGNLELRRNVIDHEPRRTDFTD